MPHADAFKLPFALDREQLARDASRLERLAGLPQPGPHHKGEWKGIALHSAGGAQSAAPAFPSLEPHRFTPESEEAPYVRKVISSLPFRLGVVRLLSLPPGGVIGEHVDLETNFQFGLLRLHLPLQTNPDVEFVIRGRRYDMQVGELWYGDFSLPHRVSNRGRSVRLHVVADVEINSALVALLPEEHLAAQAKHGPISHHRPALTAADDLESFGCRFALPGTILPLLMLGRLADMIAGAAAEVRCRGGDLIMLLEDTPFCRLVRVADEEFGFLGFPPGCFLRLRRASGRVANVTLVVRGVQSDLVAARVGVLRGERIPERQIALTLA